MFYLKEQGKLSAENAILFLDDINGTGSTVSGHIHSHLEAFSTAGKVYVGHLTGYRFAEEALPQKLKERLAIPSNQSPFKEGVNPDNIAYVKPTSAKISLTNPQHPIMTELTTNQQLALQNSENDFEGEVTNQAYFWSRPDNLESYLGYFIDQVIGIPFRR